MRSSLLVSFCLVATVSATVNVTVNFHRDVGIPLATRIKAAEDRLTSSRQLADPKIVGGAVAPVNAYPFVAGLIIYFTNNPGISACTSSLINTNRLVTSAHCWHYNGFFVNYYIVVLGSPLLFSGGTRIVTNQVVVHPQWQPLTFTNDIAVIYLPQPVQFSAAIFPVALPHNNLWETFAGDIAIAAGYGKTSDAQAGISANTVISYVNLRVMSVAECQQVYGSVYVQQSSICTAGTGGVGICQGDSGGPLVVTRNGQHTLVGVSSFVASDGCQAGFPSVYARVTSFYSFIMQN